MTVPGAIFSLILATLPLGNCGGSFALIISTVNILQVSLADCEFGVANPESLTQTEARYRLTPTSEDKNGLKVPSEGPRLTRT